MDIHKKDIIVHIGNEKRFVNLKWYRGANRYNNGATLYGDKYRLRIILSRAKNFNKKPPIASNR
jgi:hypothetical protein